jgi:prepilin-type processing-associated H-X9-DG protein
MMAGAAAILVAWPSQANSNTSSKAMVCLSNLRHLSMAWQMYSQENLSRLVENYHGAEAIEPHPRNSPWASGWLTWNSQDDNTNILKLRTAKYARLAPYFTTERNIHKCPEDVYRTVSSNWIRVRSVALNGPLGAGNLIMGASDPNWAQIVTMGGFASVAKPPSQIYTFLDEHPNSINDPLFFPPTSSSWVDVPSSYHDGKLSLAFADGHAELHAWQGVLRTNPVKRGTPSVRSSPSDPDFQWVRNHTALRQYP